MCYILMVNDEVYRDKSKGGTNLGFFITRECKKDHKCKQVFCQTIIGTEGVYTRHYG